MTQQDLTTELPAVPHPLVEPCVSPPVPPQAPRVRPVAPSVARTAPTRHRSATLDLTALASPETLRAVARGLIFWLLATLFGIALVVYLIGPLFASHDQRVRTEELRLAIGQAYGAANDSLEGAAPVTRAPEVGTAVSLLQLPRLAVQQTVAEGANGATMRGGVSHVPGTAAVGQPGNAVLVGRRSAFGGPFGELAGLRVGDQLLCLTSQGRSTYVVSSVARRPIGDGIYDPTDRDQLTLLASGSRLPWNASTAVVVTATMQGAPYVPTPQNGFSKAQDGRHGDTSAWALLVLELLALVVTVVASSVLYRRWARAATYLITTPALVALVVFVSLTGSRLLPGWF